MSTYIHRETRPLINTFYSKSSRVVGGRPSCSLLEEGYRIIYAAVIAHPRNRVQTCYVLNSREIAWDRGCDSSKSGIFVVAGCVRRDLTAAVPRPRTDERLKGLP